MSAVDTLPLEDPSSPPPQPVLSSDPKEALVCSTSSTTTVHPGSDQVEGSLRLEAGSADPEEGLVARVFLPGASPDSVVMTSALSLSNEGCLPDRVQQPFENWCHLRRHSQENFEVNDIARLCLPESPSEKEKIVWPASFTIAQGEQDKPSGPADGEMALLPLSNIMGTGSAGTVYRLHNSPILAKVYGPAYGQYPDHKWWLEFCREAHVYQRYLSDLEGVVPHFYGAYASYESGTAVILLEDCGSPLPCWGLGYSSRSLTVFRLCVQLALRGVTQTSGDLSSRNMVRSADGSIRIIDFGKASVKQSADECRSWLCWLVRRKLNLHRWDIEDELEHLGVKPPWP